MGTVHRRDRQETGAPHHHKPQLAGLARQHGVVVRVAHRLLNVVHHEVHQLVEPLEHTDDLAAANELDADLGVLVLVQVKDCLALGAVLLVLGPSSTLEVSTGRGGGGGGEGTYLIVVSVATGSVAVVVSVLVVALVTLVALALVAVAVLALVLALVGLRGFRHGMVRRMRLRAKKTEGGGKKKRVGYDSKREGWGGGDVRLNSVEYLTLQMSVLLCFTLRYNYKRGARLGGLGLKP